MPLTVKENVGMKSGTQYPDSPDANVEIKSSLHSRPKNTVLVDVLQTFSPEAERLWLNVGRNFGFDSIQ